MERIEKIFDSNIDLPEEEVHYEDIFDYVVEPKKQEDIKLFSSENEKDTQEEQEFNPFSSDVEIITKEEEQEFNPFSSNNGILKKEQEFNPFLSNVEIDSTDEIDTKEEFNPFSSNNELVKETPYFNPFGEYYDTIDIIETEDGVKITRKSQEEPQIMEKNEKSSSELKERIRKINKKHRIRHMFKRISRYFDNTAKIIENDLDTIGYYLRKAKTNIKKSNDELIYNIIKLKDNKVIRYYGIHTKHQLERLIGRKIKDKANITADIKNIFINSSKKISINFKNNVQNLKDNSSKILRKGAYIKKIKIEKLKNDFITIKKSINKPIVKINNTGKSIIENLNKFNFTKFDTKKLSEKISLVRIYCTVKVIKAKKKINNLLINKNILSKSKTIYILNRTPKYVGKHINPNQKISMISVMLQPKPKYEAKHANPSQKITMFNTMFQPMPKYQPKHAIEMIDNTKKKKIKNLSFININLFKNIKLNKSKVEGQIVNRQNIQVSEDLPSVKIKKIG